MSSDSVSSDLERLGELAYREFRNRVVPVIHDDDGTGASDVIYAVVSETDLRTGSNRQVNVLDADAQSVALSDSDHAVRVDGRQSGKNAETSSQDLWCRGKQDMLSILTEYGEYLGDVHAIFERPLLSDVTNPKVAAFYDAWDEAKSMEFDDRPHSEDLICRFAVAARKARLAWQAADRYARQIGISTLDDRDASILRKARSALDRALDPAVTEAERTLAMNRCVEMIAKVASPDRFSHMTSHLRLLESKRVLMLTSS